jgi:hypothetical protein
MECIRSVPVIKGGPWHEYFENGLASCTRNQEAGAWCRTHTVYPKHSPASLQHVRGCIVPCATLLAPHSMQVGVLACGVAHGACKPNNLMTPMVVGTTQQG